MSFKSNLGQGAIPVAGFGPGVFPGQFPVGALPTGKCPSGYLPAPSSTIPNTYVCVRAPGAYNVPLAGKKR